MTLKRNKDQPEKRAEYIGRAVTLNGHPAKIVREGAFAAIAPLDSSKGTLQYSWGAVFRTCDNRDGQFA